MKRYESREARFSSRVLLNYVAAQLPETLSVRAAANGAPTEILLYDEIGFWGVTAKDFVLALAGVGDGEIIVRINSPGGDVFDGLAIYNALKARSSAVHVVVDGIAASAASFIAMAGTDITMAEQSMLMIHNAWGIVIGDRNDMLETAGIMEKVDGQLAAIYAARSGKPVAEIAAMLDAETWFTSTEAKDAGLCDAVSTIRPGASASMRAPTEARARQAAVIAAAYDPDGDGDDDAAEAIGFIQSAMASLGSAIGALSGDDAGSAEVVDPAASAKDAALDAAAKAAGGVIDASLKTRQRRLRLAEAEAA